MANALPFAADAVAVGVSGLSLLGFRTERPKGGPAPGSILDGARRLMGDRALRLLVALLAALAGLQGLVGGVLVLVATKRWGLHPSAYGAFLAAGAVGNVPGALLANRIVMRIGNVPALIGCALVSGLGYLVMAFAHGWVVGGAAFAFVGFAIAAGSVIANSLRQRLTPAELMGRVGCSVARHRVRAPSPSARSSEAGSPRSAGCNCRCPSPAWHSAPSPWASQDRSRAGSARRIGRSPRPATRAPASASDTPRPR